MKEEFIELLRSTKREGIENLLNFLEKSDFYTAPASTRFHGNYEGGLLEHSMKVYEIFKEKIKASGLSTPEDTVIIAPLLHDICKTNYYKVDYRNAKMQEENGRKFHIMLLKIQYHMGMVKNL